MPSTRKRVLVRTRARGLVRGYLDPQDFREGASVQFLSPDGQLVRLPVADIKAIYFVSSFDVAENLGERRAGRSRPRLDGLWVRVRFHDHDTLEGLLGNNLLELDGSGLYLAPASISADFQRVYVPRESIASATVLGVIGTQRAGTRRAPAAVADVSQGDLFANRV
ncbi:MAG: DUF6982 domain-containing protein [Terriglobales bacterium]